MLKVTVQGEKGNMPDDEEPKKVVKKKLVKKVVKRPEGDGQQPKPDGDALAAFGITETKDDSKAKMVTPVAKPTSMATHPKPPVEGEAKKVVPKKVVKKVAVKPPTTAPTPKPVAVEPEDVVEVEPIEEKPPASAQTVDEGKKGGIRDLLAKKKTGTEPKPVAEGMDDNGVGTTVVQPKAPVGDGPKEDGKSEPVLDDIDLDKITQNIQEDLLETFEEKIDDILVDIIDDEDAVEELTRDDEPKSVEPDDVSEEDIDDFLKESEGKATTKVEPKPVVTAPPPKPAPVKTVAPPPKPAPRPEIAPRPETRLEADVESPKKGASSDEPVIMEKDEVKMITDTSPPKKEMTKSVTDRDEGIRIDEGDVREQRVAYKVAHNFDKLPPNMRNELLRNLAKVGDPKVREDVVCAIATHFKNLPPDIQGILTSLTRDEDARVREEVVFEIQKNFENISMAVRERILKALLLDKEPSVREEVAATICEHYTDLSSEVRELLKTLTKDKARSVRDELMFELQKADSPVPKEVREELIGMLKGTR